MGGSLVRHFARHRWLYLALLCGAAAFFALAGREFNLRTAVASDAFYAAYLVLFGIFELGLPLERFRDWADDEDEGLAPVVAITLTAVFFSLGAIFVLLNQGRRPDGLLLLFALISAPLGWLFLHVSASLHYAHFYYERRGIPEGGGSGGLDFPGTDNPGLWDFLYYSFVIGMTAQVSDVQVTSTRMRRLTLGHAVVSFLYNTVLIALAVNVVVAMTQPAS